MDIQKVGDPNRLFKKEKLRKYQIFYDFFELKKVQLTLHTTKKNQLLCFLLTVEDSRRWYIYKSYRVYNHRSKTKADQTLTSVT